MPVTYTCDEEEYVIPTSEELITILNEKVGKAELYLQNLCETNPNQIVESLLRHNFQDQEPWPDYQNQIDDEIYYHRLIRAYAFEYSVLWESVLKDYINGDIDQLGCTSFGCGSCIEAWSFAYAKTKLLSTLHEQQNDNEEFNKLLKLQIYYTGVDRAKWPLSMLFEETEEEQIIEWTRTLRGMFTNMPLEGNGRFKESDVFNYIDKNCDRLAYRNVLIFPKIINEFDGTALCGDERKEYIDGVLWAIGKGDFSKCDRYYLIVSHSKTDVVSVNHAEPVFRPSYSDDRHHGSKGRYFVEKINSIFEGKGYHPDNTVLNNVIDSYPQLIRDEETGIYYFRRDIQDDMPRRHNRVNYIDRLNPDFAGTDSSALCSDYLSRTYEENRPENGPESFRWSPMKKADYFYFQVVSYTR